MGHVWTLDHVKPATDLIRCVNKKYVTRVTSDIGDPTWLDYYNADLSAIIWQVPGDSDKTLSPGTFISKACGGCDPPTREFYAL